MSRPSCTDFSVHEYHAAQSSVINQRKDTATADQEVERVVH